MLKKIASVFILLLLISCYKDELETANKDNETLRSQITALNSQINSLNLQIATLTSQVGSLNAEILRLKGVVEDADVEIAELEDIIVSYQTQLLELQTALLDAETSNENLLTNNKELLSSLSTNIEVLRYVSNRIISITNKFNYSSQANTARLSSLVQDLKSFLLMYNELKQNKGLNISLLNNIRAVQLLNNVDFFEWGEGNVPGVVTVDCNWIKILTDSRKSTLVALHPISNTLLLTHASGLENRYILNSENDNLQFFENHFGTPKKILYITSRQYREESVLIEHLANKGHIVDFLRISKSQYDLEDYPQLSHEYLVNYDGLVFDHGTSRPSIEILNNLKDFVADPTTTTAMFSLGWVWASYSSVYVGEPLPLNQVIAPLGAKFNTWTNDVAISVQVLTNYYPNTYSEVEICE